jgi:hypothetical protein
MKKSLTAISTLLLLTVILSAADAVAAQTIGGAPPTAKRLTLTFELKDLPGREALGSYWEVSYEWRIADRREFDRWATAGEDPAEMRRLGLLLSKASFKRDHLSDSGRRNFSTTVPVRGELLERLRDAGRRQQIVWLDAFVRVHDAHLGTDVIKKVNPVWGPNFYLEGNAHLRMELTGEGRLVWHRTSTAPWADAERRGMKSARTPSPE